MSKCSGTLLLWIKMSPIFDSAISWCWLLPNIKFLCERGKWTFPVIKLAMNKWLSLFAQEWLARPFSERDQLKPKRRVLSSDWSNRKVSLPVSHRFSKALLLLKHFNFSSCWKDCHRSWGHTPESKIIIQQ